MASIGSVLGKLFGNKADDVATRALTRTVANNADNVATRLASNYADDASRSVLSSLSSEVVPSNVRKNSFLNKVADTLDTAGNTALNSGRSVTRKGMREAGKKAKTNIADIYRRTGISDPGKQAEFGLTLTGGKNSIWDNITNNLRKNDFVLDKVDLTDMADDITSIIDSFPSSIRRRINYKNPEEMSRIFKSEGNRLLRSASPTTGQTELARMMIDTGNAIDNRIDDVVSYVDPEAIDRAYTSYADEARRLAGQARLDGNTEFMKAYNRLADEVESIPMNERSIQGLRSLKSDFVTSNKLENLSGQSQGGGSLTGLSSGKMGSIIPSGLANTAEAVIGVPAQAATNKVGAGLIRASDALRNPVTQRNIKNAALVGGGLLGLSMLNNGADATGQDVTGVGGAGYGMSNGGVSPTGAINLGSGSFGDPSVAVEPTVGGYTANELENAYVAALMDSNSDAADAIASMMDLLNNKIESQSTSSDTKTDAKKQTAVKQMDSLMNLYQQAGGGQGAGGHLTNLLNTVTFGNSNPSANAYQSQRTAAAVSLARAAGDTGALSDRDIQSYMQMLPSITDSERVATLKIQSIYDMLGV